MNLKRALVVILVFAGFLYLLLFLRQSFDDADVQSARTLFFQAHPQHENSDCQFDLFSRYQQLVRIQCGKDAVWVVDLAKKSIERLEERTEGESS